MTLKTSKLVSNECPTQDNIIDCSVCIFECKLRMSTKEQEAEIPPESLPAVIYY